VLTPVPPASPAPAPSAITSADIAAALAGLGVRPDDTLFVHAGLQGSGRIAGARSRDKLGTIVDGLTAAVAGGTLVLPTFTYSHCWGNDFDRDRTPSTVGQLSEHFRSLPGVRRTFDPIFSTAVLGPVDAPFEDALFTPGDRECFGERSIFAQLLARDATILFWDVGFGYCTFVHHVEQRVGVGYRYLKPFTGTVLDGEQPPARVVTRFLVRHLDQEADPHFDPLAEDLLATGAARRAQLPGGPTLLVARCRAIAEASERGVAANPLFLVRSGHGLEPLPQDVAA
jgi:aminoglycoside 3-N-acetyltransferase